MGQAHDLLAAVAETLPDAVLIGAVCFGDGDFSVPDGDGIIAAIFGLEHHFLIDLKIDGHGFVAVFDLRQL